MFHDRIRESYDSLTPGFRKLADFVTHNTLDAAFLTTAELAARVGVDPATVIRFAQEIGYSGYRELSKEIKEYLHNQITTTYHKVTEAKSETELIEAIEEHLLSTLQQTFATETSSLVRAAHVLNQAPQIWIAGEFTSFALAQLLAQRMQAIGIHAVAFQPGMTESASVITAMQSGDALLGIAFGQPGIDTGYAMKLAREKGVTTLCLCHSSTILPAREADIVLTATTNSPISFASFHALVVLSSMLVEAI
ncbi:MAG: MurR/RpiR family transcriptional regulator, partial [Anaerolineae bacterium]|nr:MurR/RpiR family transcriptional regulator [Anaerolineae bacterium]